MSSITDAPVAIRISPQLVPSTPLWFGEVRVLAQYLRHLGVLATIEEQVRFARRRFGHYDLIDFTPITQRGDQGRDGSRITRHARRPGCFSPEFKAQSAASQVF